MPFYPRCRLWICASTLSSTKLILSHEKGYGKVHGYEGRGGNGDSFGNKCVRYYDEQLW